MRVVLDTNVLVSGTAYPESTPGRIVRLWHQGGLEVVLSRYILDELARVLPRLPRIQLTTDEIRDLADSFLALADIIEPAASENPELRDAADQPILALLLESHADCLITGDKDLLALAEQFPILTPATFWLHHGLAPETKI